MKFQEIWGLQFCMEGLYPPLESDFLVKSAALQDDSKLQKLDSHTKWRRLSTVGRATGAALSNNRTTRAVNWDRWPVLLGLVSNASGENQ